MLTLHARRNSCFHTWWLAAAVCVLTLASWTVLAEPNQAVDLEPNSVPTEVDSAYEASGKSSEENPASSQTESPATNDAPAVPTSTSPADPRATSMAEPISPGKYYGAWVFTPPLITIILAIWLRQVIPAMFIGILIAAYMAVYPSMAGVADFLWRGTSLVVDDYYIGSITSTGNARVLTFASLIAGMSSIIVANGGSAAAVRRVARWASNRARGQLSTWFAGLLVFFDDYSNAMIVGPSMRPVTDKLKISREKLAYVVDSTAAPIASIALIGSWIGVEIQYIQTGLDELNLSTGGGQFADTSAYQIFLASIPYRFYPILAIAMVALVAITNRDFGPMRKAEQLAADKKSSDVETLAEPPRGRQWLALFPIGALIFCTFGMLTVTGLEGLNGLPAEADFWQDQLPAIAQATQSSRSILFGTFASVIVAFFVTLWARALSFGEICKAFTDGLAHIMPTLAVLVSAWAIGSAMKALEIGTVAKDILEAAEFPVVWLPMVIFIAACVVSFSTGTSYGTMGLLVPSAVVISAGLLEGMEADQAMPLFYGSVGAVLAGAVFGDHCSPISDTTVLSSVAADCPVERHVWTQIPYAVVTALAGMICGDVLCHVYDWPIWSGLLSGIGLLLVFLLVVGRPPKPSQATVDG